MLLHYTRIALRNLSRQKVLSFINVFGLSVGIACFSLCLLYIVNESSYDRFHKNGNNLYRVIDWYTGDRDREPGGDASSYTPVGPAMKQDLPDVVNYARFMEGRKHFVKTDGKVSQSTLSFADKQFLGMFSFHLIEGNPTDALNDPHSLVITKDKAIQLFGNTDVIGKRVDIRMDDASSFEPFKIGGVVDNIPATSTIQFDMVGNFDYILASEDGKASLTNWHMTLGTNTFVQLRDGSKLARNAPQIASFRSKYYKEEENDMKKQGRWNGKDVYPLSFRLQSITDMHTSAKVDSGAPGSTTDPKNLWILGCIAAGVLLIACINFTTLSIGRSAGRAKEIGVRKVIGSGRKMLIYQFLTESMLLSLFSGIIGLLLANALLPFFNQLSGRQMHFSFNQFPQLVWILGGLIVFVGILAGSYPALVLSAFKPVEVLKSKVKINGANLFTRSLVTFQFALSIALIISTLIIFRQLNYMRTKNIGLNKENVVMVDAKGIDTKKVYPLFKQSLASNRAIVGIAASEMGLGDGEGQMGGGFKYGEQEIGAIEYPVDAGYLQLLGMKLIAGRNFDPSIPTDSAQSVIVNENLATAELGLSPEKAIGQRLEAHGHQFKTIIGVTTDFNFEPLNRKVRGQLFSMPAGFTPEKYFIRVPAGDPAKVLSDIQSAWKKIVPEYPFQYSFLDESLNRFYQSEQKWSSIAGWAGGISIFLACLGLFGLAALAAINRTKEIGIRKVMGASMTSIVGLLSKDFLKLVIISMLIASPVAWYFMNKWLQDYAYRIDMGYIVFLITGLLALSIALITIGIQAVKAAVANPVESLRTE